MFLCSMFGVVIVSFVVVTVRNELEMTTLESKAYTVIKKIEIKNKMKHEAATIIGKAAKLYLQVKKNQTIPTKDIYDLNNNIMSFKSKRR